MTGSSQPDETHDPARRSLVESANAPGPIQNLPLGIFSTKADAVPRIGVAIGDRVLDLKKTSGLDALPTGIDRSAFEQTSLNALFGQGRSALRELRFAVANLLDQGAGGNETRRRAADLLLPADECVFHRPTEVSNYTDFYAGIYHAIAAGALLTPENPLPQNYKWVPTAYHGRAFLPDH
jgi:fumarylacetoacetase